MTRSSEPWERGLREGLDALAGAVDQEQPPGLGALIMLVSDVRRQQRQAFRRDLQRFLAVAVLILCGYTWASLRFPVYFLVAQGVLAVAMAAGLALVRAGERRATHE